MVAGPFSEIEQPHSRVPMWYYTLPGREADGERAFGKTPRDDRRVRTRHRRPVSVRALLADRGRRLHLRRDGEHVGDDADRSRLHDERAHLDYSAEYLASHELAHQWFGDLVTCRDWSHAWLNEGFATYFEAIWLEADKGWDEYLYDVYGTVQRYLDEDAERYRRPIVCNVFHDPIELFDRHLYEKGGAVLHMLRGELGWERMKRSLKRYVRDNAQRNVETIDLIRAIEAETGRNLRRFFDQWVERGGHPQIEVSYRWDGDRKTALLTVLQKQPIDDAAQAYVFDLEVGFVSGELGPIQSNFGGGPLPGEQRVRLTVNAAQRTFAVPMEHEPSLVRVDPGAWTLSAWTSSLGIDVHAAILRADPSPVARIRAAKALAKEDGRVARETLAHALGTDPFWGVAVEVAAALGDSHAPSARATLARARRPFASEGAPRGRRSARHVARRRRRLGAAATSRRSVVFRRRRRAARARQDARSARVRRARRRDVDAVVERDDRGRGDPWPRRLGRLARARRAACRAAAGAPRTVRAGPRSARSPISRRWSTRSGRVRSMRSNAR